MKARELRELTEEELDRKEEDLSSELLNLRFQLATGQIENPLRIRYVRRDLARVKTIKRERELESDIDEEN